MIENIIRILIDYRAALLQGLEVTGKLCLIIWAAGLVIGISLGILAHRFRIFEFLVIVGSFLVASIPILVLLFWLHYPLKKLWVLLLTHFLQLLLLFPE